MTLEQAEQEAAGPPSTGTGITARLVFSKQTVESGGTLSGELVVDNETGQPVAFGGTCATLWAVTLRSESIPNAPAFYLPCKPTEKFSVGRTTFPFSVQANFNMCGPPGLPGSPSCSTDGAPAPLPPGSYQAVFGTLGDSPIQPGPVPITVVPASP
jgi:hypothetical protein